MKKKLLKKITFFLIIFYLLICLFSFFVFNRSENGTITYFGRSSIKIKTFSGIVIYIDPYANGDYSELANLILVTHGHFDHNKITLVKKDEKTIIIAPRNALNINYKIMDVNQIFELNDIKIETFYAYNKNHPKGSCLSYIISFDNFTFYHAGDTDLIDEMKQLRDKNITIAALPCDGVYNMNPKMADEAAYLISPKFFMPIHSSPTGYFEESNIKLLKFPNLLILKPGENIEIKKLKF